MTHRAANGDGPGERPKPLEQQEDDTQGDDQGGKETIPDSTEPAQG